jgi:hypothetical protein
VREGEFRGRRELIRLEPAQLDEIVTGPSLAAPMRRPCEAEHDPTVVGLEPEAEEIDRLDLESCLFTNLPPQAVERMLVLMEKPAGQIPETFPGIERAKPQEHATLLVKADRFCAGSRVRITDVATGRALGTVLDLVDSLAADRTEAPGVERTHGRDHARSGGGGARGVSPRAAGATQHELSRIGLLATLPGETLARLAQNMIREDIPAGAGVVTEGESGDRFYVVLSGMLAVSQRSRGAQSVLRPGDYFGEVALAMDMPRTASVRALTPVTVASCDRETFDEFVRPLFADEA